MSKIEIEIKGRLENTTLKIFRNWVEANATYIGQENHHEAYLDHTNNSFFTTLKNGEIDAADFLRIRKSKATSICLKKWRTDSSGDLTFCDEYDLGVSSFSHALELFCALGYTPKAQINKIRTIYQASNFEIVFDEVSNLGSFFEIEWIGTEKIAPEVALAKIKEFMLSTGIKSYLRLRRGYVSMLLNPSISYEISEKI